MVNHLVVSDPKRDILKIAVVERHHASPQVSLGLVKGFGLKKGAIGSSVAHDSHNIIIIGTNDRDMLKVCKHIAAMGGGLALAAAEKIVGSLPLPIAGLMSDLPLFEVKKRMDYLDKISLVVFDNFKVFRKGKLVAENGKLKEYVRIYCPYIARWGEVSVSVSVYCPYSSRWCGVGEVSCGVDGVFGCSFSDLSIKIFKFFIFFAKTLDNRSIKMYNIDKD